MKISLSINIIAFESAGQLVDPLFKTNVVDDIQTRKERVFKTNVVDDIQTRKERSLRKSVFQLAALTDTT